jgi:hypothetical protein
MSPNLAGLPPRYLRTPEAIRFVGSSNSSGLSPVISRPEPFAIQA